MSVENTEPGSKEFFRQMSDFRRHLKNKSKNDLIRIVTALVIEKLEAKQSKES